MNAVLRSFSRHRFQLSSLTFPPAMFNSSGPPTQILRCDSSSISFSSSVESEETPEVSSSNSLSSLKLAARHLVTLNNVVVFPTETVYGLGANALSSQAVSRIFSTKGRPQDNPLIVHVSSLPMLYRILPENYKLSRTYRALVEAFWPGALTLLFPASPEIIPQSVTAGHPTVAVRMPSHPVARALIAFSNTPLAAPSANTSGKPSPTRAEHVKQDLEGKVEIILDGGPCEIGLESTVVDGMSNGRELRVLRPGGVTVEDLERVVAQLREQDPTLPVPRILVHKRDYQDAVVEAAPTTPGMKYKHYSPSVPVIMVMTLSKAREELACHSFTELLQKVSTSLENDGTEMRKIGLLAPSDSGLLQHLPSSPLPIQYFALGAKADPAMSAARLFDGLLTLERDGADVILLEEISEEREGLAFMNRARKASGEAVYLTESDQ